MNVLEIAALAFVHMKVLAIHCSIQAFVYTFNVLEIVPLVSVYVNVLSLQAFMYT